MNTQTNTTEQQHIPQQLPTLGWDNDDYFVDFRLQEIRPIETPWIRIPFVFIMDEELKALLRGLRADHWGNEYMSGLDN